MSGKLFLCPTPIGNLDDITLRTLNVLKSVDLIAAEDTRVSIKLLNHFSIQKPLTSYYEHNKRDLVRLCIQNGIPVEALPGPCAFATALVASGLPTGRFAFEGFLTTNRKNRLEHLQAICEDTRTLIFYEAPHKLLSTLKDMEQVLGDRSIVLARELTKKYEEYRRTTLSAAIAHYSETPPKGEFVLILQGADAEECRARQMAELPSCEELLRIYAKGDLRAKELTKKVAEELKIPRREVYDTYLKIKETL